MYLMSFCTYSLGSSLKSGLSMSGATQMPLYLGLSILGTHRRHTQEQQVKSQVQRDSCCYPNPDPLSSIKHTQSTPPQEHQNNMHRPAHPATFVPTWPCAHPWIFLHCCHRRTNRSNTLMSVQHACCAVHPPSAPEHAALLTSWPSTRPCTQGWGWWGPPTRHHPHHPSPLHRRQQQQGHRTPAAAASALTPGDQHQPDGSLQQLQSRWPGTHTHTQHSTDTLPNAAVSANARPAPASLLPATPHSTTATMRCGLHPKCNQRSS